MRNGPRNRPFATQVLPQSAASCRKSSAGGDRMRTILAVAAIAILAAPAAAQAQERAGDAALGAVSGAVVLGPVGAVAGAVIGFTAGPSIARAWGLNRPAPPPRAKRSSAPPRPQTTTQPRQPTSARTASATVGQASANVAPPAKPKPQPSRAAKMPPVQALE